jgi:hypothetical protein
MYTEYSVHGERWTAIYLAEQIVVRDEASHVSQDLENGAAEHSDGKADESTRIDGLNRV